MHYVCAAVCCIVMLTACQKTNAAKEVGMNALNGKKIALVIANNNFREEEYFEPKQVLENAGATVVTVARTTVTAQDVIHKTLVTPDITLDALARDLNGYDAVAFIGGMGAQTYWHDPAAHALAYATLDKQKILGAICAGVGVLAYADILKGKKATTYSGLIPTLKERGALVPNEHVVRDGNIVTADGPQSATEFGIELGKAINNEQ